MFSTLLEIAGLSSLTAGAYFAGGPGNESHAAAALFVGGFCLLLLGYSTDDVNVNVVGAISTAIKDLKAKRVAKKSKG